MASDTGGKRPKLASAELLNSLPREEVRRRIAHLREHDASAYCAAIARLIRDDD